MGISLQCIKTSLKYKTMYHNPWYQYPTTAGWIMYDWHNTICKLYYYMLWNNKSYKKSIIFFRLSFSCDLLILFRTPLCCISFNCFPCVLSGILSFFHSIFSLIFHLNFWDWIKSYISHSLFSFFSTFCIVFILSSLPSLHLSLRPSSILPAFVYFYTLQF